MVQAARAGRADVHAGTLAHRLNALYDRDRTCVVGQGQASWKGYAPAGHAGPVRSSACPSGALTFYLGGPSASAVSVTRAATAAYPPLAGPPWLFRSAYFHPRDGAVPQFGIEPPDQRGGEQPHLGGPRCGVSDHDKLALGEPVRQGVRGEVGPYDLVPAAEHRGHRAGRLPALIIDEPFDRGVQRLRVVPAGPPGAARPVGTVGTLVATREPVSMNRPDRWCLAAGPCVGLRSGQRLAGEPRALVRITVRHAVRHGGSPQRPPRTAPRPARRGHRRARPR